MDMLYIPAIASFSGSASGPWHRLLPAGYLSAQGPSCLR